MTNPVDEFNKGGAVSVNGGGADIAKKKLKVKSVFAESKDFDGKTVYSYKIEVIDTEGNIMYAFQPMFVNDNGSIGNPAMPGNKKYAPTPIFEIIESYKSLIGETKHEARKKKFTDKDGKRIWKDYLEGMEFEMDVKSGDKRAGGQYHILMTQRQKQKEEKERAEYKGKQDGTSQSGDLTQDFDNSIQTDDLPF